MPRSSPLRCCVSFFTLTCYCCELFPISAYPFFLLRRDCVLSRPVYLVNYVLMYVRWNTELGTTVGVIKLDGRMSVDQRDRALSAFQGNSSYQLLLMSLKAGGVALNLTAANHVFLMDPWWNPAVEYLSSQRVHSEFIAGFCAPPPPPPPPLPSSYKQVMF